ncbi:MAG: hypothetical protein NTY19_45115 [Planctomycetota bacterium]|nr:hypothetical protein [Planctomycetota bacterium]
MISTIVLAVTLMASGVALARTAVYQPLGTWVDPQVETYLRWNASRQAQVARSLAPESRPQLAGLRSKDVELLQDALLRKHPKLLRNSPATARSHILRLHLSRNPLNVLNGALAEAVFLENNPEWGYVKSPNASQHDVYRWIHGRPTPNNGQIKFFEKFDASRYARAMVKDSRAHSFLIPDDHVEPMKAYLRAKAEKMTLASNPVEAKRLWKDYSHLRPIGATTGELISRREKVYRELRSEKNATYVSLGASLALALGPTAWDWMNGSLPANQAMYRSTRVLSVLGVVAGTNVALMSVKQGALRGTVRGNVIVGTALTITEVTWLLHEHGWGQAFYQPSFYEQVVGGVSGISLGLAGGVVGTALASETGPWAPVIGFGAGVVTGTVGYIGGCSATHTILQMISPAMLQQQERQQLASVQSNIERTIATAQKWPPAK